MRTERNQEISSPEGNIFVISAPSGSGKTTLIKRLMATVPELIFSVSHTTRSPRLGERKGREYFFVTPTRFRRMVTAGKFVEWAQVFGHLYGTTWDQLNMARRSGSDVLLDIDVQGHRQLRRRLPDAVSILVLPPSFKELERRLRRRHLDTPEVIAKRLACARGEITHWREYDFLIINDQVGRALQAMRAVVTAARHRRQVVAGRVQQICESFGG